MKLHAGTGSELARYVASSSLARVLVARLQFSSMMIFKSMTSKLLRSNLGEATCVRKIVSMHGFIKIPDILFQMSILLTPVFKHKSFKRHFYNYRTRAIIIRGY